jgi:hypothetical protein
MTAPRRRWSFSLRTLFVGVMVLGCWLAWDIAIIRNRAAVKAWAERENYQFIGMKDGLTYLKSIEGLGDIPWHRRLLGDEGYPLILPPDGFQPGDCGPIRSAFPESELNSARTTF